MSSLYSYFRDKRFVSFESADEPDEKREERKRAIEALVAIRWKFVRIDPVISDLEVDVRQKGYWFDSADDWMSIPKVTPAFSNMWFEGCLEGTRCCALVIRGEYDGPENFEGDVKPKWDVLLIGGIWTSNKGLWMDSAIVRCSLSEAGKVLAINEVFSTSDEIVLTDRTRGFLFASMHALARMNCANISIRPTTSRKQDPKKQPYKGIVWHEIVVDSVPNIPTGGGHRDAVEVRSHWVRGHYADYTKGKGLFGNPKLKCVFWIPEHKRGNDAIGEVISTYRVEAMKGADQVTDLQQAHQCE